MAEVKLKATTREGAGKGVARKVRAGGRVPGILYGRGMTPMKIAVDRREFVTALHTDAGMNVLLDIEIDGTTTLALTRELQRDPVRGTLLHADFVKVDRKTAIEIEVPVVLTGEAHGVKEGGVLEHPLFAVSVRCLPTAVPEQVEADVSGLAVGDSLRVADLATEESYEILADPETVIAHVAAPISEEELEALEAGAGIVTEEPALVGDEGSATEEGETSGGAEPAEG
ncbi:MAG TPA: 50S ribosomal protein L25/general stress protein Ctc [Actinomycetota bacterium]|nr:50S ribosomal protein L25/general stress protein Ctc [Actinomycetota bacterium]